MSRSTRRLLTAALGIVLLLAALAASAGAYLTAGGSASATATVATLPAPTLTATAGASSVALQWTAVRAPGAGAVTYSVTRDGGVPAGDCPGDRSPRSVTSCTDTGVALGRHTYVVTARWRTWTGVSASASATVASGPVTQLVFTAQPGGTATGGTAFPNQPAVTARDANNQVVTSYAGTVTLSILRGGASGAALSGCTGTLVNGVTTFSGCKIDKASGNSYYLRASDGTRTADSNSFTVSTGPLAQLLFTTQPGSGTGGSDLSTQPVVTAADAGGNVVTSASSTVELSIAPGTGAADATLSGCDDSRRNGVTTFDNCEIDRAGTGYRLRATDGTRTVDSNTFNVTPGSTSALLFSTQPGGSITGGTAFPTQPVITPVDAVGNVVTNYANALTLAISSGTGTSGAVLSACRGTRVNGVTTYSGCAIDRAGTGYRLRASDSSRSVTSSSFNVGVGPLAALDFTSQPSSATAGSSFSTQPVVAGTDAGGNVITSYAGTIDLTITPGTGTPGATLSGCGKSARNGVTTFSSCRLDRSGSGYQLHATDGTLSTDTSSFTVSPGSVSTIAFTTQPGGAITGGTAFPTQPVVTAYDALGNVATGYTSTATMSILSGTGTRGAALQTCTGSRSNGVVTFSGCKIDRAGTGYQLHVSDTGGRSDDSDAFNVTVGRAAALSLAPATSTPVAGATDNLTITATDAGGNIVTDYTGAKGLTFGGATASPIGTLPTVTNSAGAATAFGTATSITFANGVATVSGGANGAMVLRDADSDTITVTDGTIGGRVSITIAPGAAARLAWTSVSRSNGTLSIPCFFTCTLTGAGNGATFTATVSVTDNEGNVASDIGRNHTVAITTPTSGTGSGGAFTSPRSSTAVSLTLDDDGSAETTDDFTFRAQQFGTWTLNTFTAASSGYTSATANVNK